MTDPEPTLKPCPFCGSEMFRSDYITNAACVECAGCGATGPSLHIADFDDEVAAWNTRADDWRPIETAPKDGTVVDLWVTVEGCAFRAADFQWEVDVWCKRGDRMDPLYLKYLTAGVVPTHWRPLPAPPGDDR